MKHGQEDSEPQGPELNWYINDTQSLLATIYGTAIYSRVPSESPEIVVLQNLN